MGNAITQEQIEQVLTSAGLPDNYNIQQNRSTGNFQITLQDLGALTSLDTSIHLAKIATALLKDGLMEDRDKVMQLSYATPVKDTEGRTIFRPFPCCWVNQPEEATQIARENSGRMDKIEGMLAQILQGQGIATSTPEIPAPEVVENTTPQAETLEVPVF